MMTLPTVDLATASRDKLVALVVAQQAVIGRLQERIAALEQRLGSSGGKGLPGPRPAGNQRPRATGKPRTRRARGYARRRSLTPTRQVTHAAAVCPTCGTPLRGGWVVRRRAVIDLPVTPVAVVEHLVVARRGPCGERDITPTVDLEEVVVEVVVGRQRLSARLVSLLAPLHEVGRRPLQTVQWRMRTVYDLHVSVGRLVAASAQVAQRGAAAVMAIRDQSRASPAVHADETGWRQNGRNGYVWTFATPTLRSVAHGTREGALVETVLGETCRGILAADCSAASHHDPGLGRRCWAHLLREVHDRTHLYPDDAALATWKEAVQMLYHEARAFTSPEARARVAAQQRFAQRLDTVCAPVADDPVAVHAKLCRRIRRHLSERFVFVAQPEVPADNNLAERSLRPLVTTRTISGGTRSDAGTATKLATATLFGTWLTQGRDPLPACRQLLLSGRV